LNVLAGVLLVPSAHGRIRTMLIHTTPGAIAWPAAMFVWGPGYSATAHRHHCIQLVMALQGTLLIRRGGGTRWLRCGAALVRPDALHEVDARNATVLIAFVDAESDWGSALNEHIEKDIFPIPEDQLARWRRRLGQGLNQRRVDQWARLELLRARRPARIHPRVQRVMKYLRERIGVVDDFSLKTLAGMSGLSQTRFMHVFTESVGVPLRPYILWLRLQRACCDLMDGHTITQSAHNAGFSDAAHLTRTFRRMLGVSPAELSLRNRVSSGVSVETNSL
jgi:AraC-like DNA-binding protein